jgi:hypothetical protein
MLHAKTRLPDGGRSYEGQGLRRVGTIPDRFGVGQPSALTALVLWLVRLILPPVQPGFQQACGSILFPLAIGLLSAPMLVVPLRSRSCLL